MGFSEAAEAVGSHLSRFQKHDSLDVLSRVVDEAAQSDYYKPTSCLESTHTNCFSVIGLDSEQSQRFRPDSPVSNSVEEQSLGTPFYQLIDDSEFNKEANGMSVVHLKDMKGYDNIGLKSIWDPLSSRYDLMKCTLFTQLIIPQMIRNGVFSTSIPFIRGVCTSSQCSIVLI